MWIVVATYTCRGMQLSIVYETQPELFSAQMLCTYIREMACTQALHRAARRYAIWLFVLYVIAAIIFTCLGGIALPCLI